MFSHQTESQSEVKPEVQTQRRFEPSGEPHPKRGKETLKTMKIPTLFEELRRLRKRFGWTIFQVGERVGVSGGMISLYETREVAIPSQTLRRIAQLYEVDFEYLYFLSLPIPMEYKQLITQNPQAPKAILRHLGIRPQPGEISLLVRLFEKVIRDDPQKRQSHQTLLDQFEEIELPDPLPLWVRYYRARFACALGQSEQGTALLTALYDETGPAEAPTVPDLWQKVGMRLGQEHFTKGRYSQAIPYLHACQEHFGRQRDFAGLTLALVQLAELCEETGDERSMGGYFKHSFNAVGLAKNEFYARVRQSYGAVQARLGAWDDAEEALLEALEVWGQLDSPRERLETHLLLADVSRQQKRWVKAQRELNAARDLLHQKNLDDWMIWSGKVDCAEAQLIWDKGEKAQAIRRFRQIQTWYLNLAEEHAGAETIALKAGGALVEMYITEGDFGAALTQARSLLEQMPLACPRDAVAQGELLHLLFPAFEPPAFAAELSTLVAQTKAKLSEDNPEHAPLWAIVSCMEAEAALTQEAYGDVVSLIRTAVRWTLDTEAVAIRQRVLKTLTVQLERLRESQPESAEAVHQKLKRLLSEHPPPRHRHQREHVEDCFLMWSGR